MSDLNAAATLSMKIDTGSAAAELVALRKAYTELKEDLAKGMQAVGGASSLTAELTKAKATIQEMDRALKTAAVAQDALEKKFKEAQSTYKQAADQANYLLSVQLKSAEMTGNAAVKAANDVARAKNQANSLELKVIRQEELQAVRDAERAAKELARAKNLANSLELRVIAAEEAGKLVEAERAAKELARAKNLANSLELKVIRQEELQAVREAERAAKELARAKNLANSLELRVIRQEEVQAVREAERAAKELARAKNLANSLELKVIAAEEAGKLAEAERAAKELARAKNLANSLELKVIRQEELQAVRDAERAAKELARAKNAANNLELRVISAEQSAALRAAKKDAEDLARWMALTDKQQASATLKAAKAFYGGADQGTLPGAAGSAQALAAAQQAGSVQAAQKALDGLSSAHARAGATAKQAGEHQHYWNKAANEGHALARGLSGSLGTLWMTYGSILPLLTGAALGGAFVQAAKQGSEFAYQLMFIKTLGGETADTIVRLGEAAQAYGRNSMIGSNEAASGMRMLAQAGLSASDAIVAMSSVIDLAIVGEMNMEQAATTLVGVMNAFSLTTNSLEHIGDVFAKAAALSQTSVQGMTEAMKYASVVGEQYGASLEDTATAITLLAKMNIQGTSAGTSFRNMLKELYSPTEKAAAAIKSIGLATKEQNGDLRNFTDIIFDLRDRLGDFNKSAQVNILQAIFGERGAKEAIAMLGAGRDAWNQLNGEISKSSGFMRGVAQELEATTKGTWTQAINTMKSSLINAFQESEMPMKSMAVQMKGMFASSEFQAGVSNVVSLVSSLAQGLLSIAPVALGAVGALAKFSDVISGGVAGLTAMLTVIGIAKGASGFAGLLSVMAAGINPVTGVALAVGAVTAALIMMQERTPDSVLAIQNFNAALDTQIEKLKIVNKELQNKLTLSGQSAADDKFTAERELGKAKKELADAQRIVSDFDQSVKAHTNSGVMGAVWDMGSEKYKEYTRALEVVRKLPSEIKKAELNVAIAEGYEMEKARNASKVMAQDLIRQQELQDKMKVGASDWEQPNKKKAGGASTKLPKDWEFEREKQAVELNAQLQKREIDLLESRHAAKLTSEEDHQRDLQSIHAQYEEQNIATYMASMTRLHSVWASSSGDEKERANAHYNEMLNKYVKYLYDRELRLQKSTDREAGIIQAAQAKANEAITQARAQVETAERKLKSARGKEGMGAVDAAAYDARDNIYGIMAKPIASQEAEVAKLRMRGVSEENQELQAQIRILNDLYAEREKLADQAANTASAEMEYQRSYSYGWNSAFAQYRDDARNSAKVASDAFRQGTGLMEDALTQFVQTGKIKWRDLAQTALKYIAQVAAKQAAASLTQLAVSAIGSVAGSYFGSSATTTSGPSTAAYGSSGSSWLGNTSNIRLNANAVGNVYDSASLSRYSNGVYNTPQVFAFAKGAGIFAEAGPEAIMPLARNSQGVLGVQTVGGSGGGGDVNIAINITMDSSGASKETTSGDDAASAKRLGEVIANVTKKVLVEEMRSGGMLNSLATR